MSRQGSRWQRSVLTFGPIGRLVATGFVVAVLWWFLFPAGIFGLAGAIIWIVFIAPMLLRQIWRPAVLPSTDESRLQERVVRELNADRKPRPDHLAIHPDDKPPARW